MFGAYGLYRYDKIFAVIAGGQLYCDLPRRRVRGSRGRTRSLGRGEPVAEIRMDTYTALPNAKNCSRMRRASGLMPVNSRKASTA
ncbi:MAG: hypothetical protein ACKVQA_16385 [Burkholderiales bacterium]